MTRLTDHDIYLFREGTHTRLHDKLGCQPHGREADFAVWAPNARAVSVVGDFNGWDPHAQVLQPRWDGSGIWEARVAGTQPGQAYKYHITTAEGGTVLRGDPCAHYWEAPPRTASRIWPLDYAWGDGAWMRDRARRMRLDAPMSVYECHLGSWRRNQHGQFLGYRETALQLARYLCDMGYTHVEILPVTEHPFYGSWGYQTTGYFAPTARYGTPQDFMFFVDTLHRHGIGVILDWVPSHFPGDEHGLFRYDGTHLYEHADPRQGYHPDWNSYIFNYGRHEVRSFLLSSALFWLERYHIDGLRVDAVASMLYLDYGRKAGEWIPNRHGGKENLEAIEFIRLLNEAVYREHPDTQVIAEESTAWPLVSRPTSMGGLGFGMKWNMGWMHDTLAYFHEDPVHRRYHHQRLTFSLWYAFNENSVLPLSHDEVVYGKGSLINKMPGDHWRQFANLRLLYAYMWGHPGKKLLFMGGNIGQRSEWQHEREVEWGLLQQPEHEGVRRWVADLNRCLVSEPALHERDFESAGFEWVIADDADTSVIAFLRRGRNPDDALLVICNFTPVLRERYRVGVPRAGRWREILNSDSALYGGSGVGNYGGVDSVPVTAQGRYHSLTLALPPLGALFLKREA